MFLRMSAASGHYSGQRGAIEVSRGAAAANSRAWRNGPSARVDFSWLRRQYLRVSFRNLKRKNESARFEPGGPAFRCFWVFYGSQPSRTGRPTFPMRARAATAPCSGRVCPLSETLREWRTSRYEHTRGAKALPCSARGGGAMARRDSFPVLRRLRLRVRTEMSLSGSAN